MTPRMTPDEVAHLFDVPIDLIYAPPGHLVRLAEPAPPTTPPAWVARGCGLGNAEDRCGRPIVGAFVVCVADDAWQLDDQRPGVLLLCRGHYAALNVPLDAPPSEDPCPPPPPP